MVLLILKWLHCSTFRIFSPAEDLNLPKTGIVGMKDTSASLEALTSNSKLKVGIKYKTLYEPKTGIV